MRFFREKMIKRTAVLLIACIAVSTNSFASPEPAEEDPNVYVFEAEHTDLSQIQGAGKSNNMQGTAVITYDKFEAGASEEYFIAYLYMKGNKIVFKVSSDADIDNVKLELRATAEAGIEKIGSDEFSVTVNGNVISYRDMKFKDVVNGFFSMDSGGLRPFSDYTISSGISLKKGENEIVLEVINDTTLDGTAHAHAPIIDCIKLTVPEGTEAVLEWAEGFPDAASIKRIEQMEDE
ncbi:MAG: hypothetical protein HUJ76_01025 [Parasporobacterium sp.]|nr:hypothetical protein [Parasporobacterium sp.]